MEPLRQHYMLATGKGLQSPPSPSPAPGSAKASAGAPKAPKGRPGP
jgi:hypothetical protein